MLDELPDEFEARTAALPSSTLVHLPVASWERWAGILAPVARAVAEGDHRANVVAKAHAKLLLAPPPAGFPG